MFQRSFSSLSFWHLLLSSLSPVHRLPWRHTVVFACCQGSSPCERSIPPTAMWWVVYWICGCVFHNVVFLNENLSCSAAVEPQGGADGLLDDEFWQKKGDVCVWVCVMCSESVSCLSLINANHVHGNQCCWRRMSVEGPRLQLHSVHTSSDSHTFSLIIQESNSAFFLQTDVMHIFSPLHLFDSYSYSYFRDFKLYCHCRVKAPR